MQQGDLSLIKKQNSFQIEQSSYLEYGDTSALLGLD